MNAVLLSIQPKWCGLIASGKKTLEIRKTKPKIKTPFTVYIYCTKDKNNRFWAGKQYSYADERSHNAFDKDGNGKVIGEFVCDAIFFDETYGQNPTFYKMACMADVDIAAYCVKSPMYGWHISNLIIYDAPKPLEKFKKACRFRNDDGSCQWRKVGCECVKFDFNPDGTVNWAECCDYMSRPPQSWCYVEAQE